MSNDWPYGETLKAIFPLLDESDLTTCMLVSHQWRNMARDEYLWKCICSKKWPSISKKPPPNLSYYKLFLTLSKPRRPRPLPPSHLSFKDLEFYFDIWSENKLIFSRSIPGPLLQSGIKNLPARIPDVLRTRLQSPDYKMTIEVEPAFTVPLGRSVYVSVIAGRKDSDKIACILNKAVFDYVDGTAFRALAYEYLSFSPTHPFIAAVRAWVSLLFLSSDEESIIDVFGIEMDFCDAASSENEVLWLLDILDWN